jgi:hypothetical protein
MAKGKATKIEVIMHEPQAKKRVTRFDAEDPKAAMTSAYVEKEALASIGSPDKIKVTIEAAK